ncbi:prolyl oligopeptidase family serine peptidase [Kitasatospora purpeofusca]|uniref:prolyl oligopeptidase family serine peptidase n=1 Tax=Kitasatospora purpeofusca TaxID=67352 RepID=UPI0030F0A1BD
MDTTPAVTARSPVPAPYGTWESPVTARIAAGQHGRRPDSPAWVGDELWWTESRPEEGGRTALVRRLPNGRIRTVLSDRWSVRSTVIEYGGRAWCGWNGDRGPEAVFVNRTDQRLYRFRPGSDPVPLTPLGVDPGGFRHVDPVPVPHRAEVWCVREERTGPRPQDVRRALVAVPLGGEAADDGRLVRELACGRFLTGPRLSVDGRRVAWLGWEHPDMPWDAAELRVAEITAEGGLTGTRSLCGGRGRPVAQVEWLGPETVLVAMDLHGWWNLYRLDLAGGDPVPVCPRDEEFAGPLWRIGLRWFAPVADGRVAVLHGVGRLGAGILDTATGALRPVTGRFTEWLPALAGDGARLAGVAASATADFEVVEVDTTSGTARPVAARRPEPVDPAYVPRPTRRMFRSKHGRPVHARVFPPTNPGFTGGPGERPPFVVWPHGGPTNRFLEARDLSVAYFTSRGLGVVQVDYAGSTGYGRDYRERLNGHWGVADVEDCRTVAEALVEEGLADAGRLVVRGASAGGWTAAIALATSEVYRCGALYFPVLDLESWAGVDTHDFESHYPRSLVGPSDVIEAHGRALSPTRLADRWTRPFLLLQGLLDEVCPPAQCERFLARIRGRGVRHACLTFPDEGHGFTREDTEVVALASELALYAEVLGFTTEGGCRVDLAP